jgi:hypothetical protein
LRRLLLVPILALALAAPAAAAPLPPGDYAVQFTGGSIDPGGDVLPTIPIPGLPPTIITFGAGTTSTISIPAGALAIPPVTQNLARPCPLAPPGCMFWPSEIPITLTATLVGPVTASLDPLTGEASGTANGFLKITGTFPVLNIPINCTLGSEVSPLPITLTTAPPNGSPWDPATGSITLASALPLPPIDCDDPTVESFADALLGLTGTNNLVVILNALVTPRPSRGGDGGAGSTAAPGALVSPLPPILARLRIDSRRLRVNGRGVGRLRLTCVSAPSKCTGRLRLQSIGRLGSRAGAAVTVASARFSVPAGQSKVTRLRLSRTAMAVLRARGRLPLRAVAVVKGAPTATSRRIGVRPRVPAR